MTTKTIVRTRYRDLPLEEVQAHFNDPWKPPEDEWNKYKGYAVRIETPGVPNFGDSFKCEGPLYKIVDYRGWVCPHIVEIGD